MTTKVVKGSLWTLGGSVLPLLVSFVSTPFIIRFLGSEAYGVLLLVGLIPTYFSFADFGMGTASTRFASEAYGEGDAGKENRIVWTATAIAMIGASAVAIPIFLFSFTIVTTLNVPEHLRSQASIALKLTAVAFVFGILGSVLNSPMLARLRMDLNTVTQGVPKILLALFTPFILYLGGEIVGAVAWALAVSLATLLVVFYFSGRLLPEFVRPRIDRQLLRPLCKFGSGLVIGGLAAILLVNFEKLALSRLVSVEALAFYSVAFTFAGMATMFSNAMLQSLGPAFARLNSPDKKAEFDALFSRGMRLNLIWLPPALMFLFVVARPFFTLWAGDAFGRESTIPFYILLVGLFFNILAFVPYSTISAKGRTDIFAKLYWAELLLYVFAAVILIKSFGIIGAALAYTLRVVVDAFAIIMIAKKIANIPFSLFRHFHALLLSVAMLLPAILVAAFYNSSSVWLIVLVPLCLAAYGATVWHSFIEIEEKKWVMTRVTAFVKWTR